MNVPLLLSQPLGLMVMRAWVKAFGNARAKERFDVFRRPHFAYGLFRATEVAKYFGKSAVTVCEFGVATGNGLLQMIALCDVIGKETGIRFRIVGFDTGEGLPTVDGYKDHPEIWSAGDFTMRNRDELVNRISGRAEIIFGDIQDTIGPFTDSLDSDAPLGFIAIDVDTYSGAKYALRGLNGPAELYNPAVSIYCDDVNFFMANEWCGELAAMAEFNSANALRKIDKDRSLPGLRAVRNPDWHERMYVCHMLDHVARNRSGRDAALGLEGYQQHMNNSFSY
jgi:hypothetical protein